MKNKFKCPVCGYELQFHNLNIYRYYDCAKCGFEIEFDKKYYRKIKSLLFPAEKTCEWKSIRPIINMAKETGCGKISGGQSSYGFDYKYCPYCKGRITGGEG